MNTALPFGMLVNWFDVRAPVAKTTETAYGQRNVLLRPRNFLKTLYNILHSILRGFAAPDCQTLRALTILPATQAISKHFKKSRLWRTYQLQWLVFLNQLESSSPESRFFKTPEIISIPKNCFKCTNFIRRNVILSKLKKKNREVCWPTLHNNSQGS